MNEMRVCIESRLPTSEEACSAWFTFPVDEEEFEERIGVPIDSEDYRITEMELPFADEVGEDTTIEKLN
ncbi:conjugal transfer protein, partial [Clostridioides difficile]|nr:conjugal transfer protein [Clostridioides difficile]